MTIDEFLTNVRRIQAADPRYRLGRDGSDGYCDCIGLVIGAIRRSGGQWRGIHGTNWTARNAMHDLNPLRGAGQLQRGELVFRAHEPGAKGYALPSRYASSADRRDYYHVGVVMQTNPLRILHCSGGGVKADTSVTRWQFHGMLTMFAGRMGLMQIGDSVICIGDLELVKVHVHTNNPGKALQYAVELGELDRVKIENMLEQNRALRAKL